MSEKLIRVEHTVRVDKDSALIVFCASCLRVLAELPTAHGEDYAFSEQVARSHWNAFSLGHQISITELRTGRSEYIWGSNKFQDTQPND